MRVGGTNDAGTAATAAARVGEASPGLKTVAADNGATAGMPGPAAGSGVPGAKADAAAAADIAAATKASAAPAGQGAAPAPSFDIVRVAPTGEAVIAGRAAPGAQVTIAADGHTIAMAHADEQGQFVATPERPLGPGGQALTLAAKTGDGQPSASSAAPVIVMVPQAAGSGRTSSGPIETPLAVLAPADAAPRVLQGPIESKGRAHLALDTVDYGDTGKIRFGGSALPGAPLRLYVDNQPAGDATADPQGHWTMTPAAEVAPGRHDLRVDQLAAAGTVARRVELPFERATMPAEGLAPGRVVVEPGQNLWRMARLTYGAGIRYFVIYQANASQIRDPNLIYPGQTFALPALDGAAGGSIPTSSSRSR